MDELIQAGDTMKTRHRVVRYAAEAVTFVVEVVERFFDDHCPQLAAALAYYAIFSIPPLLILSVTVIGTFLEASSVSNVIWQGTSGFLTPKIAHQLVGMLEQANTFARTGPWWSVALSVLGVIFGATRGFYQLQTALNRAWSIHPDPQKSIIKDFLLKRLLSFGMVAITILLLTLLIIVGALFTFFGDRLDPFIPEFLSSLIAWGSGTTVSLIVTTFVLAALYKYLPDAQISWNQVLPGALCAALLFQALQSLTTFYLSQLKLNDTFGQAGSFALLLVWLYVCANIVFLGAEFAYVWSRRRGNPVRPREGSLQDRQTVADLLATKLQRKFDALR